MLGCLVALSKSTIPFEYRGTGGMAYGSSRINTIHLSIFNAAPCIVSRPPCLGTPQIILILGILCSMKPWCDHLRPLNLCPLSPNIVVAVVNLLELVWFDVELVGFDICKVWYQNRSCLVFNKSEDICKYRCQRRQRSDRYSQHGYVLWCSGYHIPQFTIVVLTMQLYLWGSRVIPLIW